MNHTRDGGTPFLGKTQICMVPKWAKKKKKVNNHHHLLKFKVKKKCFEAMKALLQAYHPPLPKIYDLFPCQQNGGGKYRYFSEVALAPNSTSTNDTGDGGGMFAWHVPGACLARYLCIKYLIYSPKFILTLGSPPSRQH